MLIQDRERIASLISKHSTLLTLPWSQRMCFTHERATQPDLGVPHHLQWHKAIPSGCSRLGSAVSFLAWISSPVHSPVTTRRCQTALASLRCWSISSHLEVFWFFERILLKHSLVHKESINSLTVNNQETSEPLYTAYPTLKVKVGEGSLPQAAGDFGPLVHRGVGWVQHLCICSGLLWNSEIF